MSFTVVPAGGAERPPGRPRRAILTLLRGLPALPAALALAACGGAATPTAGPGGASPPVTPAGGGRRTVDTVNGPVVVPANAQRIVCVNYLPAWNMLDLNATPLGTGDYPAEQIPPVYASKWTTIPKVGTISEPDVEKVVALRPDLILGLDSPGYKTAFERLSALAPTVSFAAAPSLANWDQLAEQYAGALGVTTQLAALKQRYQDRATAIKTPYGAKLSAARWAPVAVQQAGQFTLVHERAAVGRIMSDAGMPLIAAASGTETATRYSLEQLNLLTDADAILLQTAANGRYSPEAQALVDSPVFKTLQAVAGGRVYPITNFFPASYRIVFELQNELESVAKKL